MIRRSTPLKLPLAGVGGRVMAPASVSVTAPSAGATAVMRSSCEAHWTCADHGHGEIFRDTHH